MGVRGLTSYIARNADLYLQPFELHDCDLVIDGDNLACNLYKDASGCNSAFGGDYDEYYRTVVAFFHLLFECNIRPFVLLDGGYERKKMRTVEQRLRGKIAIVKHLDPCHSRPIFPLMMREVFVDAAQDCSVKVMRCIFEADDELAVLARRLDCPVLSYDSDFYIHNVKYIPLVTLTMKVLTKKLDNTKGQRLLRQCEGKNIKKRRKFNKGIKLQQTEHFANSTGGAGKTIKYLDCCLYKIENLTKGCKIGKEMLPIFAALLGNDYIETRVFRKFFSQVSLKGTNKKISKQQRHIVAILRWLKHETKESALEKIVSRMGKDRSDRLLMQMECATSGYSNERSISFEYFCIEDRDCSDEQEGSVEDIENFEEESSEELEEYDENDEISEEDSNDPSEKQEDTDVDEEISEEEHESSNCSEEYNEKLNQDPSEDVGIETETILHDGFPEWFRERIYSAQLPRFCVDLLHQNLYINNPLVENFLYPDCNKAALPILQFIYSLLHYPEKPELRYLSRVIRATNVHYKRLDPVQCNILFDPTCKSDEAIKEVFTPLNLSTETIFKRIEELSSDLRLYFLAIIYWSKKSEYSDIIHLHALIISLIILTTVDSKIIPIRREKEFFKRYRKTIQKERQSRAALSVNDEGLQQAKAEKVQELLKNLKPQEKIKFISKSECLLVQENLLKYFQQPQFNGKQHNEFSSSIMHGFSEFQSVAFQLHTLNALVNSPFKPINMGQLYCGVFLYNLYANLRTRTDIKHYVKNFLLRDSPIMIEYYEYLLSWCKPYKKFLINGETLGKASKKKNSKKMQLIQDELDDLSNQFGCLLKLER